MSVGVASIYLPNVVEDYNLSTQLSQIGVIVISVAGIMMILTMMNILELFSSADDVTFKWITYAQYAVGAFYCNKLWCILGFVRAITCRHYARVSA
jgi:hypothetical protein